MPTLSADKTLDCCSVIYFVPIFKAEKALADMAAGQVRAALIDHSIRTRGQLTF